MHQEFETYANKSNRIAEEEDFLSNEKGRGGNAKGKIDILEQEEGSHRTQYVYRNFPFISPYFLWRCMSVTGALVFVICSLYPPNKYPGGSQLNAGLTLFQSIVLWHSTSFEASASRAVALSSFLGYAWCAASILSDLMCYELSKVTLAMHAMSLGLFWLGAQANATYCIINNRYDSTFLSPRFSWEHSKMQNKEIGYLQSVRILLEAFSNVLFAVLFGIIVTLFGKGKLAGVLSPFFRCL